MTSLPSPSKGRLFELLKTLSFEEREIELVSGASSSVYMDCKQTLGLHLFEAVQALEAAASRQCGGVGGMSIGADPLATAVSVTALGHGRQLPAYLVRKEPKSHGTETYIEGRKNIPDGTPVILLEDVITTGGSTLKAARRARSEGLVPFAVAVIVDREAGGREALEQDGLLVHSLFSLSEFS